MLVFFGVKELSFNHSMLSSWLLGTMPRIQTLYGSSVQVSRAMKKIKSLFCLV